MLLYGLQLLVTATLAVLSLSKPLSTSPVSIPAEPKVDRKQLRRDCQRAIAGLPEDSERKRLPAIFGRTSAAGKYKLPTWYKTGTCGAFVEFRDPGDKSDMGSWGSVKAVLAMMNSEMYDTETVHSERIYGARQKISLIIRSYKRRPALTYQNQSTSVAEDGAAILADNEAWKD